MDYDIGAPGVIKYYQKLSFGKPRHVDMSSNEI